MNRSRFQCFKRWGHLLVTAVILISYSDRLCSDDFIVTQEKAPIKDGANVVGYSKVGDRLPIKRIQGEWVLVETVVNDKVIEAWIQKSQGFVQAPKGDPQSDAFIQQTLDMAHLFERTAKQGQEAGSNDLNVFGTAAGFYEKALERAEQSYGTSHLVTSDILSQLGSLYVQAGVYSKAEPLLQRTLRIRLPQIPADHIALSDNYHDLGCIYAARREYDKATEYFTKAIAIRKKSDNQFYHAESLRQFALLKREQEKLTDTVELLRQCVAIREKLKDQDKLTKDLISLAKTLKFMGQLNEAENIYRRAFQIEKAEHGEDTLTCAMIFYGMSEIFDGQGKFELALHAGEDALAIREKKLGADHYEVANSLNNLAQVHYHLSNYDKAISLMQRCLIITEKQSGAESEDMGTSLCSLAGFYSDMNQFGKAESLFERGISILRRPHSNQLILAVSLNNLGVLYVRMGRNIEAEKAYREALAIREKLLPGPNAEVAQTMINIATLQVSNGQYEQAEPLYHQALEIQRKTLGNDHPQVATTLNNLGLLYARLHKGKTADEFLEKSLKIRESASGGGRAELAVVLSNLGAHYNNAEQYDKAIENLTRSISVFEEVFGSDYPGMGLTINNLALAHLMKGDIEVAEKHFTRARELMLNSHNPEYHMAADNLAALYAHKQEWRKAADLIDEGARSMRAHVNNVLPGLSEKEQITFLSRSHRTSFDVSLSFGAHQKEVPEIATQSATWLINGKAVAQQSLAEQAIIQRENLDDEQQKLVERLLETRRKLSKLIFNPPSSNDHAEHRKQIELLSLQEQELSQQLAQKTSRPQRANPWVELEEIRAAIPANSIFIDIARYEDHDPTKVGQQFTRMPARFAAWITPPQGKGTTKVVDLGPAEAIETLVTQVRESIQTAPKEIPEIGEADSEANVQKRLSELAQHILHPLLPHVADSERWILSPDASLWLVPWAALPLPDGPYSIEKHPITMVVSGRDLVRPVAKEPGKSPFIFAAPNYDFSLQGEKASPQNAEVRDEQRSLEKQVLAGDLPRVTPLPATEIEAQLIRPSLAEYAHQEVMTLLADEANEKRFKSIVSPEVLVLSTHGFFLQDQVAKKAAKAATSTEDVVQTETGDPYQNPLLRCGLMLAGCNARQTVQLETGEDDGVLTGLEIVGTDLRNTKLVVLSACETGLGEVRNGEGVAGLRQAFQMAGAQTVIASLWQVPDRDTAKLMNTFFKQIGDSETKAEALRRAQIEAIEARRNRSGGAHPFFWAAFTLTGADSFLPVAELPERLLTAEAYLRRGQQKEQKGEFEAALKDYSAAIAMNPKFSEAYYERGWVHYRMRENQAALEDYNQAIELNPKNVAALVERGKLQLFSSRLDEAQADVTLAIELMPNRSNFHCLLGEVLNQKQEFDKALQQFERSIELNPNYQRAYHFKGNALVGLKRRDDAIAAFSKSLELNPQYASSYSRRGTLHLQMNQYKAAVDDLNKAINLSKVPTEVDLDNRGLAYERLGSLRNAMEDYEAVLKLNPKDAWTLNRKAHVLARMESWQEAAQAFQAAYEANRKEAAPLKDLAVVQLELNDAAAYSKTCEQILEAYKDAPGEANNSAWTTCYVPDAIKDYAPLIKTLQAELERDPDNAAYLGTLGSLLYRAGQYETAAAKSGRALELTKDEHPVEDQLFLVMSLKRLGKLDAAKEVFAKAVESMDELEKSMGRENLSWSRWSVVKRLRQEAERLMR